MQCIGLWSERISFFPVEREYLTTSVGSRVMVKVVTPLGTIFHLGFLQAQKQGLKSIQNFVRLALATKFEPRSTRRETKNSQRSHRLWIRRNKLSRKVFFTRILEQSEFVLLKTWGPTRNFCPQMRFLIPLNVFLEVHFFATQKAFENSSEKPFSKVWDTN